jgi:methenyltetrahydrofolate cyclohydrolase
METFLKVLDPGDTSTGGGSASAIAGSMAAALLAMVARLSESGGGEGIYEHSAARAGVLSQQLLEGSRQDAQAFQAVRNAYRLPRENEEGKAERKKAIQAAWQAAARIPLQNAGCCLEILELWGELTGRTNPRLDSDYRCALLLAQAGFLGCLENVAVNLPEIKDPGQAERLAGQARDLKERYTGLGLPESIIPALDENRKEVQE